MASLVAAKEKVFITQTKLLYEVTWKTVMQIAKKHVVSSMFIYYFFNLNCFLYSKYMCVLYTKIYFEIIFLVFDHAFIFIQFFNELNMKEKIHIRFNFNISKYFS